MSMINRSIERFSLMVVVSATLMIMLLVPGGYYLSSTQYLRGILDAQSELSAYEVTGLIKSNPAMWRYEEIRLSELLERPTSDNVVESRRILGTDGKIIAWNMVTVKPPRITYNGSIYDAGSIVAQIEISRSLEPLLRTTALLFFFSLVLGGVALYSFRAIPAKAINKAYLDLEESEQKFRNLFNNSEVAIFRSRLDGSEVLEVNRKFLGMLGMTQEEVIGKPSAILWADPKEREEMVRRLIADGYVSEYEYKMLDRQGGIKNCITSLVLYREQGILEGSIRDITERKQAESEKAVLEQQFYQAQKMESLGVLAGGIALDFNNILGVIMCYSSLALKKPEKAAEFMPEIEKAAERAAGLCRQMLAYAGKTQFVQSNVDVTALLDDMLSMLKSTLPQNVIIKPYLKGDLQCIEGDAGQLRQVAINMIINASEAIGEDQGDIRVALTQIKISAGQPEKDHLGNIIPAGLYLCLEVTDTGCGMDDETKQRVFEPFYTTKFVGRGLGMSAVLGIITSHKGALQLFSQPGQGTTFKVYLPVQIGESTGEEPPPQVSLPAWQGSGTILLVEDEMQLIAVAKELLEALGFSVIEASNGVEAIEQYRKNAAEIRLVVTDIGMPLMGGYELIAELKKLDPAVPIIVSSGFGDTVVTSKIARGDIAGLISKPYKFDQLREVLKSVVEKTASKQL